MKYIEENLDGEIDDKIIASIFASPQGMFQRIFTNITNMTLSEYIRKRRLTQAAHDIKNTNDKIINLALKYGYNSTVAFSSAFKSFHGVSPSAARKSDIQLKSFQSFTFTLSLSEKGVDSSMANLENMAVLLPALGLEASVQIISHMDETEIEALTLEIANRPECGISYARNLLERAFGEQKAYEILKKLTISLRVIPFDFLRKLDESQLTEFLRNEDPQTIAMVLYYAKPMLAAAVLAALPSEIQAGVASRVVFMHRVTEETINKTERRLANRLDPTTEGESTQDGNADSSKRNESFEIENLIEGFISKNPQVVETLLRHWIDSEEKP
jgi:AraC-like DNA-binding protein